MDADLVVDRVKGDGETGAGEGAQQRAAAPTGI
jgi:hypothetical protein